MSVFCGQKNAKSLPYLIFRELATLVSRVSSVSHVIESSVMLHSDAGSAPLAHPSYWGEMSHSP